MPPVSLPPYSAVPDTLKQLLDVFPKMSPQPWKLHQRLSEFCPRVTSVDCALSFCSILLWLILTKYSVDSDVELNKLSLRWTVERYCFKHRTFHVLIIERLGLVLWKVRSLNWGWRYFKYDWGLSLNLNSFSVTRLVLFVLQPNLRVAHLQTYISRASLFFFTDLYNVLQFLSTFYVTSNFTFNSWMGKNIRLKSATLSSISR